MFKPASCKKRGPVIYFQDCLISLSEMSGQPLSLGDTSVIDIHLWCVPTRTRTHSLLLLFPCFSTLVLRVVSGCSGLSHQRLLASSLTVPTLNFVYTSSWWRGFMSKLWWNFLCSEGHIYYFQLLLFSQLAEFSQHPSLVWHRRYNICWHLWTQFYVISCIVPISPESNMWKSNKSYNFLVNTQTEAVH